MVWSWIPGNLGLIGQLTRQNAYIGIVSAVTGLIIAVPLGIASSRWRWLYPPVLSAANVIYALPSLALFVALIDYTGLSDTTVIIPLTLFSLVVILPNVVDGLRSVPDDVRQAATAMGYGPLRRLAQVELPLAGPVIIAGARVATVSSISLVSVGQLIGVGGLGYLFTDGLDRDFPTEIYLGLILIIVLALACDLLLVLTRRVLTRWQRDGQSGGNAATRLASPAMQAEPPPRAGQVPLRGSVP
jgi:osmoprotectant transport system permease protein